MNLETGQPSEEKRREGKGEHYILMESCVSTPCFHNCVFLFFIYLALANMWNLLSGYCGLISLCQPAFIFGPDGTDDDRNA